MRFANVLAVAVLVAVFAAPASGTPYLVASDYQGPMRRVDPNTGATLSLFTDGWSAGELEVGADGLIYVSYFEPRMLMRLDPTSGTSVGTSPPAVRIRPFHSAA